ncbi:mycofactocin biosynthesis peptidyl-dipeptidase MftE [Microbacterium awajiense]|uniref:Mycofactocin biosynthesis peptidyl-dipeptidase MftE n=1 Tax=Microbacterium awajiense TaxID=415214 RepID=A0ABP7AL31_9MICO
MHPPRPTLGDLRWPEVEHDTVLVPIGSLEQHGPHLPLATDAVIAAAVAEALVDRARTADRSIVAAPPLPYGASGEHEGFAGTVSIGTDALSSVLIEIGRSATRWAHALVFVNAHGGNLDALRRAVPMLRSEGRDASWLMCAPGVDAPAPDAHAGRYETSLMLHLRPAEVRMERAEPGDTRPIAEILPLLRDGGVAAMSPNGVLGDPAGASADEGRMLFASVVERTGADLASDIVELDGRRHA